MTFYMAVAIALVVVGVLDWITTSWALHDKHLESMGPMRWLQRVLGALWQPIKVGVFHLLPAGLLWRFGELYPEQAMYASIIVLVAVVYNLVVVIMNIRLARRPTKT